MNKMKIFLIIAVILIIIVALYFKISKVKKNLVDAPTEFVMLESKNESNNFIPTVEQKWIDELQNKYKNKKFVSYPNEHTDLCEKICNDVYSKNEYWKKNKTHSSFLNELTKEQRIYFVLVNFESQVNNGGVYQFLFNYPELAIIALESMKITKMDKLSTDYEIVLNEYFGKFQTIQDLTVKFQNNKTEWNERWNSFAEGYKELKSSETIEKYFYEEKFVEEFQSKLTEFAKQNKGKLYKIE